MPTALTLPRPAVHLDGQLHGGLTTDLLGFTIDESVSSPARCLARFTNVRPGTGLAYKYFGLQDLAFGRRLTVWQGVPPVTLFRMFEGPIRAVEGAYPDGAPPEIAVLAEDRLADFRTRERTRVFEEMTDQDIVSAIATEHGLVASVNVTGTFPVHERVAQLDQSDSAFLLDRVLATGAHMWIEQDTLVVTDVPPAGTPSALTYGKDLLRFAVRADLRQQRTAMGVAGWDIRTKQPFNAVATAAGLPPAGPLGASGADALAAAFGPVRETLVGAGSVNAGEAAGLATAAFAHVAADFVVGHGEAAAAPGLRAGRAIELRGLGAPFSGLYQITAVRHTFDAVQGLRTEFAVRRTRIGPPDKRRQEDTAHADRDSRATRPSGSRARRGHRATGRGPSRRPGPRR